VTTPATTRTVEIASAVANAETAEFVVDFRQNLVGVGRSFDDVMPDGLHAMGEIPGEDRSRNRGGHSDYDQQNDGDPQRRFHVAIM
jgi:hypothetical protein